MPLHLDTDYSDKSIAIFGDLDSLNRFAPDILAANGMRNDKLRPANDGGPRRVGYVFSKKSLDTAQKLVARLNGMPASYTPAPVVSTSSSSVEQLVKNLSARLEAVESEVQALRKLVTGGGKAPSASVVTTTSNEDDEEADMEDEPVVKSLIRRRPNK